MINPLLLLMGVTVAGSVALSVIYVFQQATGTQRIARARTVPRRDTGMGLRSALQSRASHLPFLDALPLSAVARERVETQLDRAGIPLRVGEYLALRTGTSLFCALTAAVAGVILGVPALASVPAGAAAVAAGWAAPALWVARQHARRSAATERQLPDALTALAKSLRAGSGLLQGMSYVAEQTPAPLGVELARTLRELQLGADASEAFSRLSNRVGSADLDIAVTAIIIQRTVGGNLSEILSNVSTTIRERAKINAELQVMTARQRLTGNLMALLPALVAVAFVGLNPRMGRLLFETLAGRISLGIGIAFEILGLMLIRKFSKIDV